MSCEVYLDSNADEYEITVSGDSTCDEIEITVELEGETIPTETDPVFMAHPVYGMDASDVSNLHAPYSDAETLSTIGTLLDTAATGSPASGDSFPWIEAVGHTQKKITYGSLITAISAVVGTEPLFTASEAATITSGDTTNWDTAFSWGDHSIAGYASSGDLLNYSTTGHTHATLYEPIGTASGEVGQHEIDYDHSLIATALQSADMDGYVSTGDNISLLTNDSGYITSGGLPDYSSTYLGIAAKAADSELLDGFDSSHFAATGDLLNYSTTGHNHDTAYDLIGSASGEIGQHEIDYNHSTFITTSALDGYATSGDLINYSTTGHDHATIYDVIGAASGEVGQHEIDYDHSSFLTSSDLLDYSTTGHDHSTLYDPIGSASGAVGQHEINFVHGDYLTSGDLPDYSAVYLGINAKAADSDKLDGFDSTYFSATGHTHSYDILGAASGEVGQHEIDYLHGDYLTSGDLATYIENPMTAAGDIIIGGTSGAPTRLAKGTDGQVLKLASGVPSWAAESGGEGGGIENVVEDTTPQLGGDLDCQEHDIDNVGNIIHDEETASDFVIENADQDKDIIFKGNDGGSATEILKLDVSEGQLSGMLKAVAGVLTPAVAGTDYLAKLGIWTALSGSYASTSTFSFTGTDTDIALIQLSLFTCTDSAGTTRRIGYVKSASNSSGTITVTVVTDSNLASGDKDFKVAYNRKVFDYLHMISIPGEVIADASYSQGVWLLDIKVASYLLPVDSAVLTAAAGSGAACAWNIYADASNLFSSAADLATNSELNEQRPTTNTISAGANVSLRITSSAGATNKASDFQAKLYIVPQLIFTAF